LDEYIDFMLHWIVIDMIAAVAALTFCPAGPAQPRESWAGNFVLRSSTVASDRIDPATAERHGIEPSPTRGVLNAVVLERGANGQERPVAAKVSVVSRTLAGVTQDIPMKAVKENGRISYVGTFEFLPRETLEFVVTAAPMAKQAVSLRLQYQERMWAR
jgi:hypothetical protein